MEDTQLKYSDYIILMNVIKLIFMYTKNEMDKIKEAHAKEILALNEAAAAEAKLNIETLLQEKEQEKEVLRKKLQDAKSYYSKIKVYLKLPSKGRSTAQEKNGLTIKIQ